MSGFVVFHPIFAARWRQSSSPCSLRGGRRHRDDDARRGAGAGGPFRLLNAHGAETLEARERGPCAGREAGRRRPFQRLAGVRAARRGAARSAPAQRQAAGHQFLPHRHRRGGRRGGSSQRTQVRGARRRRAARFHRRHAPEQDRRLARAAQRLRLSGAAQRRCGTSSTAPWRATSRSASPTCRTPRRTGGGDHGCAGKKGDAVIVGAGASGSVFTAVLDPRRALWPAVT